MVEETASCLTVIDSPEGCHQQFSVPWFQDCLWDLSHLDSFAFKVEIGFEATVIVIFSCHCFTRSIGADGRPREAIPDDEIYKDAREERVLDPLRYRLSRLFLPELVLRLPSQHIIVATPGSRNFLTWRAQSGDGATLLYGVFFSVERDNRRKGRLLLRVRSAYPLDRGLTNGQQKSGKVRLRTLLKAAYEGRSIRQ